VLEVPFRGILETPDEVFGKVLWGAGTLLHLDLADSEGPSGLDAHEDVATLVAMARDQNFPSLSDVPADAALLIALACEGVLIPNRDLEAIDAVATTISTIVDLDIGNLKRAPEVHTPPWISCRVGVSTRPMAVLATGVAIGSSTRFAAIRNAALPGGLATGDVEWALAEDPADVVLGSVTAANRLGVGVATFVSLVNDHLTTRHLALEVLALGETGGRLGRAG